jgi:hypothetical protein
MITTNILKPLGCLAMLWGVTGFGIVISGEDFNANTAASAITLHRWYKSSTIRIPWQIVAGVAGLEPVTSAVTGQRSNQLSYTPAWGAIKIVELSPLVNVQLVKEAIRAADAKEVGVGNPAEETYRYPNQNPKQL